MNFDLRSAGSGNPGGMNALNVLGPQYGYAVMGADISKGVVASAVGRAIAGPIGAHLGGAMSVVGHCYPATSGFKGGKGVGASVGQCLATFPAYFPIDLGVAAITASNPRWKQRAFRGNRGELCGVGRWGSSLVAETSTESLGTEAFGRAPACEPGEQRRDRPEVHCRPESFVIGICTDSTSQLSPQLRDRFDVEVVPVNITLDGTEFAEGETLDADAFYARFTGDTTPEITTSQPSPGRIAAAYEALVQRGATEILSIHVTESVSGTLNSARVASSSTRVPVRLVDSGTASFGVSCCVWEAAEALKRGASTEEAARVAEQLAPTIGNVFIVGALDLINAGGRAKVADSKGTIPVLTLAEGQVRVVGSAGDVDEAVAIMAGFVRGWGNGLRVAVGYADSAGAPISQALEAALPIGSRDVADLVRYRIGPSVGAHTGPGTAGAFMFTPQTAR